MPSPGCATAWRASALLAAAARGGTLEPERLAALEEMDNLFPDLDLTRFV